MRRLAILAALAVQGITCKHALALVVLTFDTPVPGTIQDVNGLGIGFTDRLPRTGASLPTNDPNLLLSGGKLFTTSTRSDINGSVNLPIAEAPTLFFSGIGSADVVIKMLVDGIQLPTWSDQLGIIVGTPTNDTLRVNLHADGRYIFTENWSGSGYSDEWPFYSGPMFNNGDDILLSLARNSGLWSMSWDNLTQVSSGSTPWYSVPWLNSSNDLYFGFYHASPRTDNSVTNAIDYFSVDVGPNTGGQVPEPASWLIWGALAALAAAGRWRHRRSAG